MDLFNNLIFGFTVALSLQNLLYCFIGVLLGTLIGVLPGIGPLATIAMLLPITATVGPVAALIMLQFSEFDMAWTAVVGTAWFLAGSTITAADFQPAWIVVSLISATSALLFWSMPPDAGAEVSRRPATSGPAEATDQTQK